MERPSREIVEPIVVRLLGDAPISWRAVDEGAYSGASRWLIEMSDGATGFVKALVDPSPTHGLGVEHAVCSSVDLPCVPKELAFSQGKDDEPSVLIIEDLSHATWGIPVTNADAQALREAHAALAEIDPPANIPQPVVTPGWSGLSTRALEIVNSGLADSAWIERHLPALMKAAENVHLEGTSLVKLDTWLQNWCRLEGRGVVLVDWSWCAIGNPQIGFAWGEAAVRAAGGPQGVVLADGHPDWAAWMAGQTTWFLLERDHPVPKRLDETERREASTTLLWACTELGIEPPVHAPGFVPAGPWRP
jgi:hypothetical protein